jgi:hypothetical protein
VPEGEPRRAGEADRSPSAPASSATPPPAMRVVIEFEPGAEVAGSILAAGPAVEFHGRLELYTAIERAREADSD